MKHHLYESKEGKLHLCDSSNIHAEIKLVWTKCQIDVPAGQSFKSYYENPTCKECLQVHCDICGDHHEDSIPLSCQTGDGE